jgi:dTDP-4-amino-4,6-dideoxygalactose transaminase
VRHTYAWYLGKCLHFLFRKFNFLSQPMRYESGADFLDLPIWQLRLLEQRLKDLAEVVKQRREKMQWYWRYLKKEFWEEGVNEEVIARSAGLRVGVRVKKIERRFYLQRLARAGFFLGDIWYNAPVGPKEYLLQLAGSETIRQQMKQLKQSWEKCEQVINLPVHQEMKLKEVKRIAQILNRGVN